MWWFWAAITFPLTGVVLVIWGVFCWRQEVQLRVRGMIARTKSKKSDDVEAKG